MVQLGRLLHPSLPARIASLSISLALILPFASFAADEANLRMALPPLAVSSAASHEEDSPELRVLAHALGEMWTAEPESLVRVIDRASKASPSSPPVTFLLAIAHAETNGQILDVSEAAAIGLAQATPVAYLLEGYEGKLFLTKDYYDGVAAYLMKKPLADADRIATRVLDERRPISLREARRLLASARALRREGLDELEVLRSRAPQSFFHEIARADVANERILAELGEMLVAPRRSQLEAFRDRARRDYRDLRLVQTESWKRYQRELASTRDEFLAKHFGKPASEVKKLHSYEAGEALAENLDDRFSPTRMAEFLVRHLARKALEAEQLEGDRARLEQVTAALYNGGAVNVKRMKAGLIGSLPETERYARKVPSTRLRLERSLAAASRDENAPPAP